jgi:CO/xanthine dehydrogenase FAD-binding subunit
MEMDFIIPKTLQEVLTCLNGNNGKKQIIAGGTDLVVKIRENQILPDTVIDISEVEELAGIYEKSGFLTIGSATTLTEIAENEIVKKHYPLLAQAAASVGAVQIRNRATVGGNVSNASPAADTVPALIALGAIATVVSTEQERKVPLEELYVGVGKTVLGSNELLKSLNISEPAENSAGVFFKLGKRKAQAISIVNGAVQIGVDDNKCKFTHVRIAIGSVAPTVLRLKEVEESLLGKRINRKNIETAAEIVKNKVNPITDIRATAEYRREMSCNLFMQAVYESLNQLGISVR